MSQSGNYRSAGGGGGGNIATLQGNNGGPVGPNGFDNIFIQGALGIVVSGDPITNTLTITGGNSTLDFVTDTGTAQPTLNVININGDTTNIATTGGTPDSNDVTISLNPNLSGIISLTGASTSALRTNTSNTNTLLLQAYNTGGAAYTTFATLTAAATPTMDLSDSVTKAGGYIYRVGGNKVAVTDGGTGVGTLTNHGVLVGQGTSNVTATSAGTALQLLASSGASADPTWTTTTYVNTTNQGDLLYASAANTLASLPKSTASTRYLANTGINNDPEWNQVSLTTGVTGILPLANGGTGLNAAPTNGQLLIGNTTGNVFDLATLTAGTGITITNGGGSISIASDGSLGGSFVTDAGTAVPVAGVLNDLGSTNISTSATGNTITTSLKADISALDSITVNSGGSLRTGSTAGNTLLIQAYNNTSSSYTTFATLTANNTPAMNLSDSVTKSGQYIYRQGGTDVLVTDGGTGVSSLTTNGVVIGQLTSPLTTTNVGTDGQVLIGASGGAPAFANITSPNNTIQILEGPNSLQLDTSTSIPFQFVMDDAQIVNAIGGSILVTGAALNITTGSAGLGEIDILLNQDLVQIKSIASNYPSSPGLLRTEPFAGADYSLTAYDTGLSAHKDLATFTSGNPATLNLDTSVTIGSAYIYRVGGTDVAVTDGGTGVSSITNHGIMVGQGTSAITTKTLTNGQLLIGSTGADPVAANLTSTGSTITITNGAGSINLETAAAVATSYVTSSGTAIPSAGVLNVTQGSNMLTTGSGNTVTVALVSSPSVSGSVTAGSGLVATTGGLTIGAGSVSLPATTGASGQIMLVSNRFLHGYGDATNTTNIFAGRLSGNTTLTTASATNNSGFGNLTLGSLTTGSGNSAVGSFVLPNVTSGGANIAIGQGSGSNLTTESNNIYLNNQGTIGDANIIRIGTQGSGSFQQNKLFIAGAYNTAVGSVAGLGLIDSDGQFGSINGTNGQIAIAATGGKPAFANITSSGSTITVTNGANTINLETGTAVATSFVTSSGTATPSSGVLNVTQGSNILTTGSGNTVTVALTSSPSVSGSVTAGTGLVATTGGVTVNGGNIAITTSSKITWGGNNFLWGLTGAISSVFLGESAGNASSTGIGNVMIGKLSGFALTNGNYNTCVGGGAGLLLTSGIQNTGIGNSALGALTSGVTNTSLGYGALNGITTGNANIGIGNLAGFNYASTESSNIIIGNNGTLGESNVIRIGTQGSSQGQQNTTYIAGIYGVSVGSTNAVMVCDNTGKLGTNGSILANTVVVSGTTQTIASGTTYIPTNGSLTTLTLPTSAAVGDTFRIIGKGSGLYVLAQNSGQTVYIAAAATTTGTGGSLTAIDRYASLSVTCITANNDFVVTSSTGNFTIV